MQSRIGLLCSIGLFGLVVAADAQTLPSSTAGTRFDGTYAFVSSTKLNETYTTGPGGHMGQCQDLQTVTPLVIVNGQARRDGNSGFAGTVGSQGELAIRSGSTPGWHGIQPGNEFAVSGRIDAAGMARVRLTGRRCSYDWCGVRNRDSRNCAADPARAVRGSPEPALLYCSPR